MMIARWLMVLGLLGAPAAGLSSCTSDEEETPSACLSKSSAYLAALTAAPGEVLLEEQVPISSCLTPDQEGGELAGIGEEMIAAATELNAEARQDPGGDAAVQLGYLVGAVERGQEGIHADLVRRLNAAARFGPDGLLPPEFERTFGRGYAAGLESG